METTLAAAASVLGPREVTWKKVLLLASSLWFCIVASLVSARLLAERTFG